MIKAFRLKRKQQGLRVIVGIGLLKSLIPVLDALLNQPTSLAQVFQDWQKTWIVLQTPLLFLLLWLTCFSLVKLTQDKKIHSAFFERFDFWKGLAVILIWPAFVFWKDLLVNFHQALDFLHPFTSLILLHAIASIRAGSGEFWPNLLWGKYFFQNVGSDRVGQAIASFVGVGCLAFFYMTGVSLATPPAFAITTVGTAVEAHDVSFIVHWKTGGFRGSYCALDVNAGGSAAEFALNTCPPCAREPGAKVVVRHHPIDYQNRRMNSVECEGDHPLAKITSLPAYQ